MPRHKIAHDHQVDQCHKCCASASETSDEEDERRPKDFCTNIPKKRMAMSPDPRSILLQRRHGIEPIFLFFRSPHSRNYGHLLVCRQPRRQDGEAAKVRPKQSRRGNQMVQGLQELSSVAAFGDKGSATKCVFCRDRNEKK